MRTNGGSFTQTPTTQPTTTTTSSKTATNAATISGMNGAKSGPGTNIRTASNSKLSIHGNSLSEMTVLSSLMKSATSVSASTGMKSTNPTNGSSGSGGSVAAMVRKEPSKRTVTNVRKAIEDAALYHGKDTSSTQDQSKHDHRVDNWHEKTEKDDYEGDKVIKKDRKGLTEDDRRMVEELSAWGDHDNYDDGDDF